MLIKSCLGSAAVLAIANLIPSAIALEHVRLRSSADFEETWHERPVKDDMISEMNELKYKKLIDHGKRPVVGVLTEPLRGDLYHSNDRTREKVLSTDDAVPGYVPRSHVQFLEQAGIRVVPIDYRLSRNELVSLFD